MLVAVGPFFTEADLLEVLSGPDLHVVRRCVDVADLVAVAATRQARVAVVASQLRGLDATTVARLALEQVGVVGVTATADSADEAQLRALGIELVVVASAPGGVVEAIAEARARVSDKPPVRGGGVAVHDRAEFGHERRGMASSPSPSDDAGAGPRGRVIAIWGASGSPGRSTLALGLAAGLAELGAPTTLVDIDVYGGTAAQLLGLLDESSGLLAATRQANLGAFGAAELARHARSLSPTLRVLTGLPRADRWTELRPALLRRLLEAARTLSAFTVLDCADSLETDEDVSYDTTAPRRNGATIAALELADTVVAVGTADPVGLGRLIRAVTELADTVTHERPVVVVNRMRGSLGWSEDEIASTLRHTVGVDRVTFLPEDQAACDRAVAHGRTLCEAAPSAKLTKAVRALAADIAGVTTRRAGRVR
ncbi:MAG: chromosome partitioning protein [Propionibacteriales bacterium]|nr:chromosome partitioning protein [Propionibacteriales bacterium]